MPLLRYWHHIVSTLNYWCSFLFYWPYQCIPMSQWTNMTLWFSTSTSIVRQLVFSKFIQYAFYYSLGIYIITEVCFQSILLQVVSVAQRIYRRVTFFAKISSINTGQRRIHGDPNRRVTWFIHGPPTTNSGLSLYRSFTDKIMYKNDNAKKHQSKVSPLKS